MDPFESLVKPTDPLWEKRIQVHKIKYIGIEPITIYYSPCWRYITKETNYVQIGFQNIKKIRNI